MGFAAKIKIIFMFQEMSDNEVEKFEITDYDLEHEFSRRPGRRQTKEQQIYGMWAQESGGEEVS